jgi:general secretion pathway protein M
MNRWIESTLSTWKGLSLRERYLLKGSVLLVLGGLSYSLLWQPTQQRLANAERHYQHQLGLMVRVQSAQPVRSETINARPLPARISERAVAAGLHLQEMEVDNDQVRLTIIAQAHVLLSWFAELERDGIALQQLSLEKRDSLLEARVVL